MWRQLNKLDRFWGPLAAIVGIFTLGAGTTAFLMDKLDQGSAQHAGAVNIRLNDLASRVDRVVTFVKEQLGLVKADQDNIRKEVSTQYQAINSRLDQQNMLMVEVLKAVKDRKGNEAAADESGSSSGWSLIDSAHAAVKKAATN